MVLIPAVAGNEMHAITLKTAIPGPKSKALLARGAAAVPQGPFNVAPMFADHGEGATLTDVDGNVFLDFSGGLGSLNAGHANPTRRDLSKDWFQEGDASLHSA
jgi:4-aminobutyrate aminotransferase/(S)-3-amino-2-methylpropionate transaminase